jgi:transaldolase/glucose-6-phosphate isomerase
VREKIANRLGWLTAPPLMVASLDRLRATADEVRQHGFEDVVLLGMGSSLAPEVLRAVIGVAPGSPRLHMLDATDPAAIKTVNTVPARTIYILASKSGTTIEAELAGRAFGSCSRRGRHSQLGRALHRDHRSGHRAGDARATQRFRHTFINPATSAAFSALSFSVSCRRRPSWAGTSEPS